MWTAKNRGRYDRSKLRYPSDLTDDEWAHVEPLIPPAKRGGNKRHVEVREVMNGIMYILSTGCQWRAIPKDLPPRSTLRAMREPKSQRCGRAAATNGSCHGRAANVLDGLNLEVDGVLAPATRQAISAFQSANGLVVTGNLDKPTRDAARRLAAYQATAGTGSSAAASASDAAWNDQR
jgi:transposase